MQLLLSLFLVAFVNASIASIWSPRDAQETNQPVYEPVSQKIVQLPPGISSEEPSSILLDHASTNTPSYSLKEANILQDLHAALSTMQDNYFAVWLGKYTSAIDWTAAVMSTYVSATLSTLSHSLSYTMPGTFDKSRKLDVEAQMVENEINKYFAQTSAYYFGEDHFAIRMQAFDDMLWVVLGWLEATMFIESHSHSHYTPNKASDKAWHAIQFVPAFAHRARVFYELAEKGWDWRLCGGGMTWNPRLLPYKNAITNQLFISASISMYLHFPGDENCSPFLAQYDASRPQEGQLFDDCDEQRRGRFDPVYLANAINGYNWLRNSGMLNNQGLYTDGFHIAGYSTNHSKTTCDERNEMVYTYNQGVILSGLRGLWEATGNTTYLEDGHTLVQNVIRATGWTNPSDLHPPTSSSSSKQHASSWSGLGAQGILTELCDPSGHCNQDAQTFKGIFFHHLTAFCAPLPLHALRPGKTHAATRETAALHHNSCTGYTSWVTHNARAALKTRDASGRFGAWWGAPSTSTTQTVFPESEMRRNATDYRNGVFGDDEELYREISSGSFGQVYMDGMGGARQVVGVRGDDGDDEGDLNDRGRGRTVETQGGGVAVVRAMWVFLQRAEGGAE